MGQDWINQGVEAIRNRELPPPTGQVSPPPVFRYAFGTPERRFEIEFIDYAGGNIDPAMAQEKIAAELRARIADMDGLLVLLEVPEESSDNDEERQKAFDAATKLAKAFALITGQFDKQKSEPLDFPVALLVNKWDKKGSELLEYSNISEIKKELNGLFRNQNLPHANLRATLKAGLREGDFRIFPVSALGICAMPDNDYGKPVPRNHWPLVPFYLLEPFVWITKQRDDVDFAKLTEKGKLARKWWQCIVPSVSWEQVQRGKRLLSRLTEGTHKHDTAASVALKHKAAVSAALRLWKVIFVGHCAILLTVFLTATLVIELTYDQSEFRPIRTIIDSVGKDEQELGRAHDWLTKYINDSWYRHWAMRILFLPKTSKGQMWKNTVFGQLDKMRWDTVAIGPTLKEKAERAEKYKNSCQTEHT